MTDGLQFDKAEPARPSESLLCAGCRKPLVDSFYLAGPQKICVTCRDQVQAQLDGGPKGPRVAKAILIGLFISVVGGSLWAFITSKTEGSFSGLLAILLGYLVGIGVRKGSEGRGGRGFQVLAVLLTYLGLAIGFSGLMIPEFIKKQPKAGTEAPSPSVESKAPEEKPAEPVSATPMSTGGCVVGVLVLLGFWLASPVFVAIKSPLIILMLAIALWEGWRINRGINLTLKGPFPLGPGAAPGGNAGG